MKPNDSVLGQALTHTLRFAQGRRGRNQNCLLVRSHFCLGVEPTADRENDPHQADDEQRGGDEIAAGLDKGGKCITERGGDGPEQEEQERGQNHHGDQHDAWKKRTIDWRSWLRHHRSILTSAVLLHAERAFWHGTAPVEEQAGQARRLSPSEC
jgi:hypothetical protein